MEQFPFFIISLSTSSGRRRRMKERLIHLGFLDSNIFFLDATTPSTLPPHKIQNILLDKKDLCTSSNSVLLSCLDSHLKTIFYIASQPIPGAIIMEDDMLFLPNAKKIISSLTPSLLSQSIPLLMFKWTTVNFPRTAFSFYLNPNSYILHKDTSNMWSAGCYWISHTHASFLTSSLKHIPYKSGDTSENIITMHPSHFYIEPPLAIEEPINISNIRDTNSANEITDMRWNVANYSTVEDENWHIVYAMRMTQNKKEFDKLKSVLNIDLLDDDFQKIIRQKEDLMNCKVINK